MPPPIRSRLDDISSDTNCYPVKVILSKEALPDWWITTTDGRLAGKGNSLTDSSIRRDCIFSRSLLLSGYWI
uniref:Uncharacterized protein n=1 Tax=Oryza glumipatula TaxID=40148 RepID=A0A0E0BRB1_9ORYZ